MRADRRSTQLRVLCLKGPGDESRETLCFVLLHAHTFQMFDAILHGFHVAEHHGSGGVQAEPMRDIHHAQPIVGHGL